MTIVTIVGAHFPRQQRQQDEGVWTVGRLEDVGRKVLKARMPERRPAGVGQDDWAMLTAFVNGTDVREIADQHGVALATAHRRIWRVAERLDLDGELSGMAGRVNVARSILSLGLGSPETKRLASAVLEALGGGGR